MESSRRSLFSVFPDRIVLASASPRRAELLARFGIDFVAVPSEVPESDDPEAPPESITCANAMDKARNVQERIEAGAADGSGAPIPADSLIVACDTVVSLDGKAFGKPRNREDARHMLEALSGRTHTVTSGVCILKGDKMNVFFDQTGVTFFELRSDDILDYLDIGEYADKAGAYGIQGFGGLLVSRINGDYDNVVGLPVAHLVQALKVF